MNIFFQADENRSRNKLQVTLFYLFLVLEETDLVSILVYFFSVLPFFVLEEKVSTNLCSHIDLKAKCLKNFDQYIRICNVSVTKVPAWYEFEILTITFNVAILKNSTIEEKYLHGLTDLIKISVLLSVKNLSELVHDVIYHQLLLTF